MAKILVIEDDVDLALLLTKHLQDNLYEVTHISDGSLGLQEAERGGYELLILDLGLPGMDGLELCRKFRQSDELTPILILTARDTEIERIIGLEIGADDYMGKPFSIRELLARVRAILRRQKILSRKQQINDDSGNIDAQGLTIDLNKRRITCHSTQIELTAREFDLLYFLASNPGQVFSRAQLLDSIWGYSNDYYEHTVNSTINRLRNKIEKDPTAPQFILTARGIGYKFNDSLFLK